MTTGELGYLRLPLTKTVALGELSSAWLKHDHSLRAVLAGCARNHLRSMPHSGQRTIAATAGLRVPRTHQTDDDRCPPCRLPCWHEPSWSTAVRHAAALSTRSLGRKPCLDVRPLRYWFPWQGSGTRFPHRVRIVNACYAHNAIDRRTCTELTARQEAEDFVSHVRRRERRQSRGRRRVPPRRRPRRRRRGRQGRARWFAAPGW